MGMAAKRCFAIPFIQFKPSKMNVVIIIGSVRNGRQSQKAGYFLQKKLLQKGIDAGIVDLAEYPLPIMEERINRDPQPPANAILVTPEYHGSFSGVLKNALDYFLPEFTKKVIGVVTVGSGKMGGINASVQLQHVVLSMGAYPLPQKLIVPEVQIAFDEELNPKQELLSRQTDRFVEEFSWLAQAIATAKKLNKKEEII
jgi:azobenzene reductase